MLADSFLPTTFWAEAVNTACYVQNRVLVTKPHNKTPYELLHGRPPSISFMRPFGCPMTIINTLDPLGKFDGKADEGFLVRYSINNKAFRVFNTRTRKVEENLHITFLENKPNITGSRPDWLFDIDLLTNSMNYEPVTAGNQTNRNASIKDNVDAIPTQQYILLPFLPDSPQSSEDAVADDAGKNTTEEPTNEGERNGYANSTNRVSTISPSISVAGQSYINVDNLPIDPLMSDLKDIADLLNPGIFSGAYDNEDVGAEADLDNREDTEISKINQNCLFALFSLLKIEPNKRLYLEEGIDYDKVFAPVARIEAIRSSYLNKVYKVEKALYGLHQAPRAWYETLSTYLLENGYRRGTIDKTLFIKKDRGDILLVQVYVDDIIFGSTKKSLCVEFEQMMHKRFQMSSMGELTFFLGLQVQQKEDGIFISQDKYVADILKKFDFTTVKAASTPIETNKALNKDEEVEDVDVHLYRSMIGSLMYLTASRPDIMFAVCACARFQVTPKTSHLHAVKRIFRYLKCNTPKNACRSGNLNNLETTMNASPIPITRIHKDHPKDQIIRNINSATQTRRMTKIYEEHTLMDVKSAFLYGIIEEEVYVCQPPGFEDPQFPDKVYKVKKALYGIHQAPRAWYETLSTYLLENGFKRGTIDNTLFIKKDKGDILLVKVYVDNIIFGSTKKSLCVEFEQIMHKRFQISSMRELTFFLGLQVKQKDDGIFISQEKYVVDILKKFDFSSVKTASTQIETNKAMLKDEEAKDVDVHLYRSMIGSLMYLTASRPDIMFTVCACARFQVTPIVSHLYAAKRIFRYFKGQPKLGLWYPRDSPFDLEAFFDSDYA
ncbi:putative ribonuclease H-like domain-containing protein [Tanacetum coccineum]